ncbi:NADP-dependent aldehyde dehydrogenase [Paramicrobacterium humi]|uniref:NADP-dependent aldehyde dehydrogenase n=1 Tax=Paramicrobacterium humi TaxID=640635 RepID=A0A1H4K8E9_9MICO|nr:aldehyde dehydrogenase (NADP(+)) [Microbacterium humi]SEB54677.1 NADP-dependent aldehyde dehydrogenase [Microbacterium humi]
MSTTIEQLDRIVRTAHEAFAAARDVAPRTRANWLEAIATALEGAGDELLALAHEETHLPEGRLRGELARTVFQIRLFADEVLRGEPLDATIDHVDPSWGMGPRPDLRRVNFPLGVVGVFGSSNFPFAFSVMGGDSVSGLAAGCGVVHKIHDAHEKLGQRTAEIVIQALQAAGAPRGLFATVIGRPAGEELVTHRLVRAIGFTGSTQVGRLLLDRAAARPEPIPFYGELASINPVFVTQRAWQARKEEILREYVGSYTLGMGQFCTKPGLLFVPQLDMATSRILQAAVAAVQPAQMLTSALAGGYRKVRDEMRHRPKVEVLVAGDDGDSPAPTLLTTSVAAVLENRDILAEEMFGPASIIVQYDDESQLTQVAATLDGQLTTTVQAEPGEQLTELISELQARSGRVIWNAWPTGVTVTYAQQHGGPYPATTAAGTTSVGTAAVRRFLRPVSYQGFPDEALPLALQENNPWGIMRRVDGEWQHASKVAK